MYVFMCVTVHGTHACTHVAYVYKYACMYACKHACACICLYVGLCIEVCTHTCHTYIHVHVIHTYIDFTKLFLHTYILLSYFSSSIYYSHRPICVGECVFACVRVCVCVCVQPPSIKFCSSPFVDSTRSPLSHSA